jgi:hypothetical protein
VGHDWVANSHNSVNGDFTVADDGFLRNSVTSACAPINTLSRIIYDHEAHARKVCYVICVRIMNEYGVHIPCCRTGGI